MEERMNKKDCAVLSAAALFVSLFVLSLFPDAKKRGAKSENTVIINPDEKERLTELSLSVGKETVRFFKTGQLWAGEAGTAVFPCKAETLNRFIDRLTKTRKLYRFSSRTADFSDYTNGGQDACLISWSFGDCGKTHSLYIGKSDFSKAVRFVSADGKAVKKLAVDFADYLNASARFWCDPYIIPKNLFSKNITADDIFSISTETAGKKTILRAGMQNFTARAERLLSLRHGGIIDMSAPDDTLSAIRLSVRFTDGAAVSFSIKAVSSAEYLITYHLPEPFCYTVSVSRWTAAEGFGFTGAI